MALPRLIAVAERGWVPEQDWMLVDTRERRLQRLSEVWNEFSNRLGQRELLRLYAFSTYNTHGRQVPYASGPTGLSEDWLEFVRLY